VIIPVLRYGHNRRFFWVESNIPQLRPIVQGAEVLSKHTMQVPRTLIWIKQGSVICKQRDRCFNICSNVINIKNNRGPKTDPWGTPQLVYLRYDQVRSRRTTEEVRRFKRQPTIPSCCNLKIKQVWSTWSKTSDMSRKTILEDKIWIVGLVQTVTGTQQWS